MQSAKTEYRVTKSCLCQHEIQIGCMDVIVTMYDGASVLKDKPSKETETVLISQFTYRFYTFFQRLLPLQYMITTAEDSL